MRPTIRLIALALAAAACGGKDTQAGSDTGAATDSARAATTATTPGGAPAAPATGGATAAMADSAGRALGTLTLAQAEGGIKVDGHLTGVPAGAHGIHLHAVGQCAPPFESAGGHWNPTQKQHGTQNPNGAHLGDMPNVTADASGAHVSVTTTGGTLDSLLDADGAAVVLHATADDYKTDPSGNSGARIACGVVKR